MGEFGTSFLFAVLFGSATLVGFAVKRFQESAAEMPKDFEELKLTPKLLTRPEMYTLGLSLYVATFLAIYFLVTLFPEAVLMVASGREGDVSSAFHKLLDARYSPAFPLSVALVLTSPAFIKFAEPPERLLRRFTQGIAGVPKDVGYVLEVIRAADFLGPDKFKAACRRLGISKHAEVSLTNQLSREKLVVGHRPANTFVIRAIQFADLLVQVHLAEKGALDGHTRRARAWQQVDFAVFPNFWKLAQPDIERLRDIVKGSDFEINTPDQGQLQENGSEVDQGQANGSQVETSVPWVKEVENLLARLTALLAASISTRSVNLQRIVTAFDLFGEGSEVRFHELREQIVGLQNVGLRTRNEMAQAVGVTCLILLVAGLLVSPYARETVDQFHKDALVDGISSTNGVIRSLIEPLVRPFDALNLQSEFGCSGKDEPVGSGAGDSRPPAGLNKFNGDPGSNVNAVCRSAFDGIKSIPFEEICESPASVYAAWFKDPYAVTVSSRVPDSSKCKAQDKALRKSSSKAKADECDPGKDEILEWCARLVHPQARTTEERTIALLTDAAPFHWDTGAYTSRVIFAGLACGFGAVLAYRRKNEITAKTLKLDAGNRPIASITFGNIVDLVRVALPAAVVFSLLGQITELKAWADPIWEDMQRADSLVNALKVKAALNGLTLQVVGQVEASLAIFLGMFIMVLAGAIAPAVLAAVGIAAGDRFAGAIGDAQESLASRFRAIVGLCVAGLACVAVPILALAAAFAVQQGIHGGGILEQSIEIRQTGSNGNGQDHPNSSTTEVKSKLASNLCTGLTDPEQKAHCACLFDVSGNPRPRLSWYEVDACGKQSSVAQSQRSRPLDAGPTPQSRLEAVRTFGRRLVFQQVTNFSLLYRNTATIVFYAVLFCVIACLAFKGRRGLMISMTEAAESSSDHATPSSKMSVPPAGVA